MSDMVERVAKTLYETMYPQERNQHLPEWFVAGDGCRDLFMRYARAAIAAMREPTEAMCKAANGQDASKFPLTPVDVQAVLTAKKWQAMIDAALSNQTANDR